VTARAQAPFAVCVFCASSDRIDAANLQLATRVGDRIAGNGWTLVTGGGSVSMMGAVARAARARGGHTVGVIPRALADTEVADRDADELVVTDGMRERKALMDARADAFLALPGGIGTLEELLEIWVARSLGLHAKPVVVLDPDAVFELLRDQVASLVRAGFVREDAADQLVWAVDLDEAFAALASARPAQPGDRPPERAPAGEFLEAQP
jgi:hypothetical protein